MVSATALFSTPLFFIFLTFCDEANSSSVKAYSAHQDTLKQDSLSSLQLETPPSVQPSKDLSLCFRMKAYALLGAYPVTSIPAATDGSPTSWDLVLSTFHHQDEKELSWLAYAWSPLQWHHLCLAFQHYQKRLVLFIDGDKVLDLEDSKLPADFPKETFLSDLVLGGSGSSEDSGEDVLVGEVADFNVWDSALSGQFMTSWTTCTVTSQGNLVSWKEDGFVAVNMTRKEVDRKEICEPHEPGLVPLAESLGFLEAEGICRNLGGKMFYPNDHREAMDGLVVMANASSNCRLDFWIALWDAPSQGNFTNFYTKASPTYVNFFESQPDGQDVEDCVVLQPGGVMNDLSCSSSRCTVCRLQRRPTFTLKGVCKESNFDTKYSWTGTTSGGRYEFRGWTSSLLYFDQDEQAWILVGSEDRLSLARYNETTDYPFGKRRWTIFGGPCDQGGTGTKYLLQFNGCRRESDFACSSGRCVPMEDRCNRRDDCGGDNSDEEGCHLVAKDESYLKDYAPLQAGNKGQKVSVTTNVTVFLIHSVSETSGTFEVQFELGLTWTDARLEFRDLKEDEESNALSVEERGRIWVPEILFDNTVDKGKTRNDEANQITVNRTGPHKLSGHDAVDNTFLYSGSENPLTSTRTYNVDFLCDFQLQLYPFDVQQCQMLLKVKGSLASFIDLKPGSLEYKGPVDLTIYFVKDVSMSQEEGEIITIKITLGRRVLGVFLTTYLPTLLILFIVHCTHYFKAMYFEAIATVTLTSMLVMTTLYIGTANSLPPTYYAKMLDLWMIFGLLVTFAEFVLQTFLQFNGEERNGDDQVVGPMNDNTKRWTATTRAKVVTSIVNFFIPVASAAFVVLYFAYGFTVIM